MKSIITCDMEGIILTMNTGAEKIFGYKKNELIGKQRVSLFSPGEIVLQNVASWLDIAAKKGEYSGKTIFINKDGEKINARISITPTYSKDKNKVQNGYCGVTEVIEENVEVPISWSTKLIKLLAITRMPFTSASLLPIFLVASYFYSINLESISILNFCLCSVGVLLAHLSTNMFNDYFDNIDGELEINDIISFENTKKIQYLGQNLSDDIVFFKNDNEYYKLDNNNLLKLTNETDKNIDWSEISIMNKKLATYYLNIHQGKGVSLTRILTELHNGKFFGSIFTLILFFSSLSLIFLTLSSFIFATNIFKNKKR